MGARGGDAPATRRETLAAWRKRLALATDAAQIGIRDWPQSSGESARSVRFKEIVGLPPAANAALGGLRERLPRSPVMLVGIELKPSKEALAAFADATRPETAVLNFVLNARCDAQG